MRTTLRYWIIRLIPVCLHPGLRSLQCRAVHGLWAVLRTLPGNSRRFGPPRRLAPTLAHYARERRTAAGVSYRELHPAEPVSRTLPRTSERSVNREFLCEMHRVLPPAGIAAIANGRVLTRTGAVIASDDTFIGDVSNTFLSEDVSMHSVLAMAKLPPIRRIEGAVAVLTTFRSGTYCHWLLDTLPRLHLLHESGLAIEAELGRGRILAARNRTLR